MDSGALLDWADTAARQSLGVLVDDSFGADWRAYKVGGRVFMLANTARGNDVRVIVKVDPIRSEVLRLQYPDITAGGHRLSKRHWISIAPGKTITRALVDDEVRESYRLVQKGLPLNASISGGQGPGKRNLSQRQFQPLARKVALSLPDVSHGHPFVEKLDVYKVGDKVFMIVTDDPNEQIITLKADPEQAQSLRDRFDTVTAGRYLDKGHWISVGAGRGITRQLVTELIKTSYRSVVERMSTRDRPKEGQSKEGGT
ncbi:putative DNA-binding protein (MmcQ/YjbR family) [Variovorax boronicumulans]|uniref:MmcQ/YjbR family DNA-binding protein n=1 Tax=Variovorax boronicumulans TaxID=436515 RepID=UPI002473EC4F|nr:MmcQ/YjbR family DNA-binding protein [Variovorax boronicumulans]MDH6164940.1 putative DNA-binding protein (MmcQ/YjbR family) [Variovorax boronicumulans]